MGTVSQSKLVNVTRQKDSLTENMAVTNSTSLNGIVDLFFIAGACRTMEVAKIEQMLASSWIEDSLLTMKLVFWAGNIRGGAGERRFFRIALTWLEKNYKDTLKKNLHLVSHFNRWDSIFHLDFENVKDLIKKGLDEQNGLLGKWLPRKKQYNNLADKIRRFLNINTSTYRKLIVGLSKTVEQQMCAKEWSEIKYNQVPSVAMNKYRKAFFRNDGERFTLFIEKVTTGEEKIHADVLFPYQLYQAMERNEDKKAIEAQWYALPDYMKESKERILPICDVSGSMSSNKGLPIAISVSLGLYLSERNKSIFKDAFVTFSANPKMQYLKGSVVERMQQLNRADWDCNTDLNAVFELVLRRAKTEKVSPDEMPTMLLIISDMEFDDCGTLTNFENIQEKYAEAGYTCPTIVFWNVDARGGNNVPTVFNEQKVALVSGASPAIIKGVLNAKFITPVDVMLETLNDEVYKEIVI